MEKNNSFENLMKCAVCGQKTDNQVLVLQEEEMKTTFHLTCSSCQSSTIVFVSSGQLGMVSLGMITDLDCEEAASLLKNKAITSDQVLEVYEFLNK